MCRLGIARTKETFRAVNAYQGQSFAGARLKRCAAETMPLLVLLSLLIAMSAPACRNISLRTGKYLQEFLGDALTKWLNSLIVIVTAWLAILAVGATAVLLNNG